jgi:glucokinase
MLISTLDPAALIIGGGLGTSGGKYWDLLVEATRIHIYSDLQRALPILPAALGPDAGWIGAAAAAWMREEKPTCSQA